MRKILKRNFYTDEDVVRVAKNLLGKFLVTCIQGKTCSGMITETEAYGGEKDRASHAYGNRRTKRTESMFMSGGHAYIYLCYGMYELFNIVTGKQDVPSAVLIRAVEPVDNIPLMLKRRKMAKPETRMTAGPGVLTRALGITRNFDQSDLCANGSVWLEDRGILIREDQMIESPRVGVSYAGEDAKLKWRFRIRENPWTSPAK